MEALVLDSSFNTLAIIDTFDSFIWTDRYLGYGDFEIFMPFKPTALNPIRQDDFLLLKGHERMMIVETLEVHTDTEQGTTLTVTGRSLESLLDRRIIWGSRTIAGNFQDAIFTLLNENVINPPLTVAGEDRSAPNFLFKYSTDPNITSLNVEAQFVGDSLYDAIFALCENFNVGFRVLPHGFGEFVFELYKGIDRSYGQELLPYVIFSPKFENLLSSNYIESRRALRTAALIGGEGDGAARIMAEVSGPQTGWQRREMFVEANSVSSDDGDISQSTYEELLRQKGREELAKTQITSSFEGEIDATRQFVYGVDFFIGDIVQVINEYGMESQSRITELIRTHNLEGETFFPTFTTVENDQ